MNRKETQALVRRAYAALETLAPDKLAQVRTAALEAERRHRKGGDFRRYHPGAASAAACAEMFTVRWVAEYACAPDRLPTLADIFALRRDVILAAALVEFVKPHKILEALRAADIDPFAVAELDYCAMVGEVRVPA